MRPSLIYAEIDPLHKVYPLSLSFFQAISLLNQVLLNPPLIATVNLTPEYLLHVTLSQPFPFKYDTFHKGFQHCVLAVFTVTQVGPQELL